MTDPAQNNWKAFQRAWPAHSDYVRLAEKCNNFFLGDQWDKEDKEAIESEGRPALTINEILKVVNAVYGHYSATRADISVRPKGAEASSDLAETLTKLSNHVLDINDYDAKESTVFLDGIIEDRGFFDIRMSYSENVLGEISIRALNPREVMIDPDASEYDPSTWKEVIVTRWLSLDDVESYYGREARRKVESVAATPSATFGDKSVRYESFGTQVWVPGDVDDRQVRAVRVIERQYRRLGVAREFVDLETGATRLVPDHWEEQRVQAVSQAYGLFVRKRMIQRIRWTVSADHVTLHDDWSPYDEFTVVPFFPIFRRGRPSGLVRHLLDPQEQTNKTESQILHIINTSANSGWMVESGSLVNMTDADLEERGAETGLVLVYAKNRAKPEKIQPNQIPTGLAQFSQTARFHIADIAGAAALLGGEPNPEISGVTLDKQLNRALAGLQVIFDNLDRTRKFVARRVLRLIQKFYTEPRVYRITQRNSEGMRQEDVAINQQSGTEIVNNVMLGEYDVIVTSTPARDSFEDTQFARLVELRNAGVAIPDYRVIALTPNLQDREKIAEEVKQMQGMGDPTPEQLALQQVQMQMMQLQVAEAEAKVLSLRAQAQLAASKAQSAGAEEQIRMFEALSEHERELARLRADLAKFAANLENKVELARIHTEAKTALTRYKGLSDRIKAQEQSAAQDRADIRKALLNNLMGGGSQQEPRPVRAPGVGATPGGISQ